MNLDDLRRELRNRAGEPGGTPMPARLAGVQSKVVAARRRKAMASGVAAIASLAVIGLVSTQLVDLGPQHTDNSDLAHMPEKLNGDRLKEASYNDGASQLSWTVQLENLDVLTRATCVLPDGVVPPKSDEDPLVLAWSITTSTGQAGHYQINCGSEDNPGVGTNGPATRADWRSLGARPGTEITVDGRLEQPAGDAVDVPGAQFGVGLYNKTGDRTRSHGVVLTDVADVNDDSYELVKLKTRPLAEGKRILRLRTRASDGPIAVVYGWQSETPTAAYELTMDGEPVTTGYGGSIEEPRVVDGDTEHNLEIRAHGSTADGVLVLAYYELKD